jgi:hypothetical protein
LDPLGGLPFVPWKNPTTLPYGATLTLFSPVSKRPTGVADAAGVGDAGQLTDPPPPPP